MKSESRHVGIADGPLSRDTDEPRSGKMFYSRTSVALNSEEN